MATKKRICNRIECAPSFYIESINQDGTVTFQSGESWNKIPIRNTGRFTKRFEQGAEGFVNDQSLEFGYEESAFNHHEFTKPLIFRIQFDNGETIITGTKNNPWQLRPSNKDTNEVNVSFYRRTNELDI